MTSPNPCLPLPSLPIPPPLLNSSFLLHTSVGWEGPATLQEFLNGANIYERLVEYFRRADERYNSGYYLNNPWQWHEAPIAGEGEGAPSPSKRSKSAWSHPHPNPALNRARIEDGQRPILHFRDEKDQSETPLPRPGMGQSRIWEKCRQDSAVCDILNG